MDSHSSSTTGHCFTCECVAVRTILIVRAEMNIKFRASII